MSEHCPTCGSRVRVVSSDEGTSHYEPSDSQTERPNDCCTGLDVNTRHMIYALARETLSMRDGYERRGWVMNVMPHETAVRDELEAELREYARLSVSSPQDDPS